jgi:hypothetical protein
MARVKPRACRRRRGTLPPVDSLQVTAPAGQLSLSRAQHRRQAEIGSAALSAATCVRYSGHATRQECVGGIGHNGS